MIWPFLTTFVVGTAVGAIIAWLSIFLILAIISADGPDEEDEVY